MEKEKQNQLRRIVKKARKRVNSKYENVEWLNYRFDASLKAYVQLIEKRPPNDIILEMANLLEYTYENSRRNIEAHANGTRTREEWEQLERKFIGYPPELESGKKFCAAWDCFNQLDHGRKKYCSERCRHEQKAAQKRLKETGTLLPVKTYKSFRLEYASKRQEKHEYHTEYIETYSRNNPYDLRMIGAKRKKIRPTVDNKNGSHKIHVRINNQDDPQRQNVFTVDINTGKKNIISEEKYGVYYRLVE